MADFIPRKARHIKSTWEGNVQAALDYLLASTPIIYLDAADLADRVTNSTLLSGQLYYDTDNNLLYFATGVNAYEAFPTSLALVLNKTYAQLSAMATGASLIPGQKYRITDFRTRHTIPNTVGTAVAYDDGATYAINDYVLYGTNNDKYFCIQETTGGNNPTDPAYWTLYGTTINEGSTEALIVTAATTSTLLSEATSDTYPQDILRYELVCTHSFNGNIIPDPAADRGWIYYREDTLQRNKHGYDVRAARWRRWEHPAYSLSPGNSSFYGSLTDPTPETPLSYQYVDVPTYEDYTVVYENDFSMGFGWKTNNTSYVNNVFYNSGHSVFNNKTNGHFYDNTFRARAYNNEFGVGFRTNIVIGVNTGDGHGAANFYYNTFIDNNSACTILGNFDTVRLLTTDNAAIVYNGGWTSITWQAIPNDHFSGSQFDGDHTEEALGIGGTWSCTYLTLSTWATGSLLIPGQKYRITDKANAIVEALTTSTYKAVEGTATIDITSLTTLDLADVVANVIILTSTNATETITAITNAPTWPVEIRPETGLAGTFTATATPLSGAGEIAMFNATQVVDGTSGESIKFKPITGMVGIYQET